MSEPRRVLLVGATGLVGTRVMEECVGRDDVRLVALTRREAPMPRGARMEMLVADPAEWDRSLATVAPDAVICALGTTWRKAGEDEAAFRAVDQELVLRVARAAKAAGTSHFVFVSSAGASIASRALYLRVRPRSRRRCARSAFSGSTCCGPACCAGRARATGGRSNGWRCSSARSSTYSCRARAGRCARSMRGWSPRRRCRPPGKRLAALSCTTTKRSGA
jgi:hypothetical protein